MSRLACVLTLTLWSSIAGGQRSWSEHSHGLRSGVSNYSMAISPIDPRIIMVGTAVGYVYRSLDGGDTWDEVRILPDDRALLSVPLMDLSVVRLPNGGTLDRSATNEPGAARVETEDPGNLMALYFRGVAAQPGAVNGLTFCASDPSIVLAATNFGLFRSRDLGLVWERVFVGSDVGENRLERVACDPTDARNLYIATQELGYRFSKDGGDTWLRPEGRFGNRVVYHVAIDPKDPRRIWVGTEFGAYVTTDGVRFDLKYHQLVPSPRALEVRFVGVTSEPIVYLGLSDGVVVSLDSGATWRRVAEEWMGHAEVKAIAIDSTDARHAFFMTRQREYQPLQPDSVRVEGRVFETQDAGATVSEVYAPRSTHVATWLEVDPGTPERLWFLTTGTLMTYDHPRTNPPPSGALAETARRRLARDPGLGHLLALGLQRARLQPHQVEQARAASSRCNLLPFLEVTGFAGTTLSDRSVSGRGWPAFRPEFIGPIDPLLSNQLGARPSTYWRGNSMGVLYSDGGVPTRNDARGTDWGVFVSLSWSFSRAVMDRREGARMWRDIYGIRQHVRWTIEDYWSERHRMLSELASASLAAPRRVAYALRIEELTTVINAMTDGALGDPSMF